MLNTRLFGISPNRFSLIGEEGPEACGGRLMAYNEIDSYGNTREESSVTEVFLMPYNGDVMSVPSDGDRTVRVRIPGTISSASTFYEPSDIQSLSLSGIAVDTNYDVFAWLVNGKLRLALGRAWSGANTRGTLPSQASVVQNNRGLWVNEWSIPNGPAAGRGLLIGSVRGTASGTSDDTLLKRFVVSAINPVPKLLLYRDESSHTYTTASWRVWNNATTTALIQWLIARPIPVGQNVVSIPIATGGGLEANNVNVVIGHKVDGTGTPAMVDGTSNTASNTYVKHGGLWLYGPEVGGALPMTPGYHSAYLMENGDTGASFIDGYISAEIMG